MSTRRYIKQTPFRGFTAVNRFFHSTVFHLNYFLYNISFIVPLFAVWLNSTLGYSTFCNFRRSVILGSVTFAVQLFYLWLHVLSMFFRHSVILHSVILPLVIRRSVFRRLVIHHSVSWCSVAQSWSLWAMKKRGGTMEWRAGTRR